MSTLPVQKPLFQGASPEAKIYWVSVLGSFPLKEAGLQVWGVETDQILEDEKLDWSVTGAHSGYIDRNILSGDPPRLQLIAEKACVTLFCEGKIYSPIEGKVKVLDRLKAKVLPLMLKDVMKDIYAELKDSFKLEDYELITHMVAEILSKYEMPSYSAEAMSKFTQEFYETARKRAPWRNNVSKKKKQSRFEKLIKEKMGSI